MFAAGGYATRRETVFAIGAGGLPLKHRIPWGVGVLVPLLLAFLFIGAGCSGGASATPPPIWPGLAYADNVLYLTGLDGHVWALDAQRGGQELWRVPPADSKEPAQFHGEPAVAGDLLLVGTSAQGLYALDRASGQTRWTIATANKAVLARPLVADGAAYFGGEDKKLRAVEVNSGRVLWEFPTEGWIWASPALADGRLYLGAMDHRLYCLDADSGQKLWQFEAGGAIAGTPAVGEGMVFFGSFDSSLYALDAASGEQKWSFKTDGWVWGGPLLHEGVVYFGATDHNVYALDAGTGALRWKFTAGDLVRATPLYHEGTLYVASRDGRLYALDPQTGQQKWSFSTDDPKAGQLLSEPVAAGDTIYVAIMNGRVAALDAASGVQRWLANPAQSK